MKKNENGFSIVEILVVIVIVGLLGAVGWLVWDRQNKGTDSQVSNTQTNQQEPQPDITSDATEETTENSNFLVIKEWGVKIPLSGVTKGAYYTYDNQFLYLNVDIEGDTGKACSAQAAISKITSYSDTADNWREQPHELDKVASKIGGAYYLIEGSQSACSETESIQYKASAIRSEWLKQGKYITLAE